MHFCGIQNQNHHFPLRKAFSRSPGDVSTWHALPAPTAASIEGVHTFAGVWWQCYSHLETSHNSSGIINFREQNV